MLDQNSDSTESSDFFNEHPFNDASVILQPANSLNVQLSTGSKAWHGPIQYRLLCCLSECMDFIATYGCIENSYAVEMRCTLDRKSANMTKEELPCLLDGYADLFQIIFKVIPFDDNSIGDDNQISTFVGVSVNGEQSEYQNFAFIMYHYRQNLFAPFYVTTTDGSLKTCFSMNDESIIRDISNFLKEWNATTCAGLTSEIGNINGNNHNMANTQNSHSMNNFDVQISSESTSENDTIIPASVAIENHLQLASQSIRKLKNKLNSIPIKMEINYPTSTDFDRLSENDLIKIIENEFNSILQIARIAMNPVHVEEVSSMETDNKECFTVSKNKNNTKRRKRIHTSQSSSNNLKCLATIVNTPNVNNILPQYAAPKVLIEPNRYQHVRMFSDLETGVCPLIQAGGEGAAQRTYVEIQVPKDGKPELYVRVRAVTVNNDKHRLKTVVRKNPPIDTPSIGCAGERGCLKFDKDDFDQKFEYTYLPISPDEHKDGKKEILVHLITWKRQGPQEQKLFKNQNLSLCKLEFGLCVRHGPGDYKLVSTISYSSIIEDGHGPVNINSDVVQPQNLCAMGGQIIELSLSVDCPKRDFSISCNNEKLDGKKFKIEKKHLFMISPPKAQTDRHLHLIILRKEYDEQRQAPMEKKLYDHIFEYVSHDEQGPHVCCRQNFVGYKIPT
ncbi:unnamed protein product [Rotaria sordida]|uniref:RHD domain-containing protein n=1 Tax=Rotaria sordida TaxID=392033 RepID=A0A813VC90_9BILA|nr:unnamed protein product [Rotaria sordida]